MRLAAHLWCLLWELGSEMCTHGPLVVTSTQQGGNCCPFFTDQETECHREQVPGLVTQRDLNSTLANGQVNAQTFYCYFYIL